MHHCSYFNYLRTILALPFWLYHFGSSISARIEFPTCTSCDLNDALHVWCHSPHHLGHLHHISYPPHSVVLARAICCKFWLLLSCLIHCHFLEALRCTGLWHWGWRSPSCLLLKAVRRWRPVDRSWDNSASRRGRTVGRLIWD